MRKQIILLLILIFIPLLSYAHGSHGTGIMAGFTHPIFGLDHLMAIVGLGLISTDHENVKKWYPIAIFLIAMTIGGLMGIGKEASSLAEWLIMASVIVFGGILAGCIKVNVTILSSLAILFGFFHGLAHGIEMPETTSAWKYIVGYLSGAALLFLLSFFVNRYLLFKYKWSKIALGILFILAGLYFTFV